MPAPQTAAEFVDLLAQSHLLAPSVVQRLREQAPADGTADAFAEALSRQRILTQFHTKQLLAGRHKGFFVGKYRTLDLLGAGGMGKVFLAEQTTMKRAVALKLLAKEAASDADMVARFRREARAVAKLRHPNIAQAHDFDRAGDTHFIVMEYVEGVSVQDLVDRNGPLGVGQACELVRQAALGLQAAHEAKFVHRDIKPGNLMVEPDGTVRVLDLGLVVSTEGNKASMTMAQKNAILGTADYIAPEQALDSHGVDIRADIYSLGCVLRFLFTADVPYPQVSLAQKLVLHQTEDMRPIREAAPGVPETVAAVIDRMTQKDPELRYAEPAEVADALSEFAEPVTPAYDAAKLVKYPREAVEQYIKYGGVAPASTGQLQLPSAETATVGQRPGSSATTPPATAAGPASAGKSMNGKSMNGKSMAGKTGRRKKKKKGQDNPEKKSKLWVGVLAGVGGCVVALIVCLYLLFGDEPTESTARSSSDTPSRANNNNSGNTNPRNQGGRGNTRKKKGRGNQGGRKKGGKSPKRPDTKKPPQKRPKIDDPQPKPPQPKPPQPKMPQKEPEKYTLANAVRSAEPGATVRVPADGPLPAETVPLSAETVKGPLTVAGPEGADRPLRRPDEGPVFTVRSAGGLTLKDLVLDGDGRGGCLVRVEGDCPGLTFENVTFRNCSGTMLLIADAAGSADAPMRVINCRFEGGDGPTPRAGVRLEADADDGKSSHVEVAGCVFDGPSSGVEVNQSVAGLAVRGCTFETAGGFGVRFAREPAGRSSLKLKSVPKWYLLQRWFPGRKVPRFNPTGPADLKLPIWKEAGSGVIDVDTQLGPKEASSAIAYAAVEVKKDGPRRLFVGADDEFILLVNGQAALKIPTHQKHRVDYTCVAPLKKGTNHVWAVVTNGRDDCAFSVWVAAGNPPLAGSVWAAVAVEKNTFSRQAKPVLFRHAPADGSSVRVRGNKFVASEHNPILVALGTGGSDDAIRAEGNEDTAAPEKRKLRGDKRGYRIIPPG